MEISKEEQQFKKKAQEFNKLLEDVAKKTGVTLRPTIRVTKYGIVPTFEYVPFNTTKENGKNGKTK